MSRLLTPIGHCSAKLRRKLQIEEEEALIGRIRIRRSNFDDQINEKTKGGRWHVDPDFAVPGPFWHRPTSPDGRVSFHYAWTVVSRSASGKSVVTDSRGRVSETGRSIGDHDEYVSRDGAVMTIGPADFDGYTGRGVATDLTSGKTEVALLSNISLDPAERARFWDAVHATARKAGPDRLVLDSKRGTKKEWGILAHAHELPQNVRDAVGDLAAGRRPRKIELQMTESEARSIIEIICRLVPGADRKKGPARFARGRKGRTQFRLEIELPDGIDNAARVRIMTRVAKEVDAIGGMYTIAIHEPDEHNDARNFHLHLVAHDRPARLIDGQWDFAIRTPVEGQAGRTNCKERRKKVVVPNLVTPSNRGDFEAFLKVLRSRYADFCNEELGKVGNARLFDPRRYSEMGIDRKPTKPLGSRLAPLEAVGVPTRPGISNAEIIWTYELQAKMKHCATERLLRDQAIEGLRATTQKMDASVAGRKSAVAALERAIRAATFLNKIEPELAEYGVTLAMAQARPAKAVDTCSRIIAELDQGRGSTTDRRNRARIERRLAEAKDFLRGINDIDRTNQAIIAEQQPLIKQALSDISSAVDHVTNAVEIPQREAGTPLAPPGPDRPDEKVSVLQHVLVAKGDPWTSAPTSECSKTGSQLRVDTPSLDSILARIKADRLVVLGPEYHGGNGYRVRGVTRDELKVLREPEVLARTQEELACLAAYQVDEIKRTDLLYRSFGPELAQVRAAACRKERPTTDNPLGVLLAYRDHPYAARRMGWIVPEQEILTSKRQSVWVRMKRSVAGALSGLQTERGEIRVEASPPAPIEVQSQLSPAPLPLSGPSLGDAIIEYAEVIRTHPDVRLLTINGEVRVDGMSLPEWQRSVFAFEDYDVVKSAIADRWDQQLTKDQEAARQNAASENFRAGKRAEIVAALGAGELVAHREDNGWRVKGQNDDLVYLAQRWSDHPQLVAAFQVSKARSSSALSPLGRQPAHHQHSSGHQPSKATSLSSFGPVSPAAGPTTPTCGGYTLDQQEWIREQQAGRGRD